MTVDRLVPSGDKAFADPLTRHAAVGRAETIAPVLAEMSAGER